MYNGNGYHKGNANKMKCKVCGYTHVKGFHQEMGSKKQYTGFLKNIKK